MFASLVPLDSLIKTLNTAINNEWSGIFHLSGPEDMAYDEIANIMANKLSINEKLIISSSGVINVPGIFKVKTTLEISKIIKKHNIYLPNTEKMVTDFLVNKNLL